MTVSAVGKGSISLSQHANLHSRVLPVVVPNAGAAGAFVACAALLCARQAPPECPRGRLCPPPTPPPTCMTVLMRRSSASDTLQEM